MINTTQPDWSVSFGQVEAALSDMAEIKRSKQSLFQFRLKNLMKAGFLPHVQSGRGRAGRYGIGDLFQLAVAVELMQFDLGPLRIVDTMQRLSDKVVSAAAEAGDYLSKGMQPLLLKNHLYLSFDPGGLESLAREYGDEPQRAERVYHGDQPADDRIARRLAIINVSRLCVDLALAASKNRLCSETEFGAMLSGWAGQQSVEKDP